MKISELESKLAEIKKVFGDIECQIQNDPELGANIVDTPDPFLVPEEYDEEDGTKVTILNIRSWPY